MWKYFLNIKHGKIKWASLYGLICSIATITVAIIADRVYKNNEMLQWMKSPLHIVISFIAYFAIYFSMGLMFWKRQEQDKT
jgi:hypothetical protein